MTDCIISAEIAETYPQFDSALRLWRRMSDLICSGEAIIRIAGGTTRPANEPAISPISPAVIGTPLSARGEEFARAQTRMCRRGYPILTEYHVRWCDKFAQVKRPLSPVANGYAYNALARRCRVCRTAAVEYYDELALRMDAHRALQQLTESTTGSADATAHQQPKHIEDLRIFRSSTLILSSTSWASALFGVRARRSLTASLSSARVAPSMIVFLAMSKACLVSIADAFYGERGGR